MTAFVNELQSFDPKKFLANYWQKKPCILRQALPGFESLISPDELSGLACEEEIESRAITGETSQNKWTLEEGPFDVEFFTKFPEKHSTLLVQKVDLLIPEVAALKSLFSFIPAWRFDDVMISFAEDQGSVGPHLDNYDVFLLQAMGKRRWQVEKKPILEEENLLADCPLRVLSHFEPSQEWILEPGDILYIPPRWAHHGVSLGQGMTYSFGFRSPAISEMIMSAGEQALRLHTEKDRYTDPDLSLAERHSKIDDTLVNRVKRQLIKTIEQDPNTHLWLGALMTASSDRPHTEDLEGFDQMSLAEARSFLDQKEGILERSDDVKWAYHCDTDKVHVFIHGSSTQLPHQEQDFIETFFTQGQVIPLEVVRPFIEASSKRGDLLAEWIQLGYLWCRKP